MVYVFCACSVPYGEVVEAYEAACGVVGACVAVGAAVCAAVGAEACAAVGGSEVGCAGWTALVACGMRVSFAPQAVKN